MGNNSKIKFDQLLEAYNGGQCIMVLIQNVLVTSKRNKIVHNFQQGY
jgi:hypothetical protein